MFWLSLAALLVLLGTGLMDTITIPRSRYGLPLVPVLLTALIATAPLARIAGLCLDALPVRIMGNISYSFYLYHLPCLQLTDRLMARQGIDACEHGFVFGLAGLGLSLAAATISFWIVERPILNAVRGRRKTSAGAR